MKKETPRANGAPHKARATTKRIARRGTPPLSDFLTGPPGDPENEARQRFPGVEPSQECLRTAFVAIAAARGASAEAAHLLARLRVTSVSDPEELDDSLAGFTVIEHDLALVGEQLEAALKGSRRAARMLRQSRRRRR